MGQEGSPGGSGELYGLICMNCMDCGLPGSSVHGILHGHGNMSPWMCSVAESWPHGVQHPRLPCPSASPGICSNSCPLSRWCHLTISFSVIWTTEHVHGDMSMENPVDRGAWQATVHRVTKSWTWLKQLSMCAHKTSSGFGSCYLLSRSTPSSLARNAEGVVCCHRLLNHRNPFVLPSTSELFIFIYFFNIRAF